MITFLANIWYRLDIGPILVRFGPLLCQQQMFVRFMSMKHEWSYRLSSSSDKTHLVQDSRLYILMQYPFPDSIHCISWADCLIISMEHLQESTPKHTVILP